MKRTVLFSVLALVLAMCSQRVFAYDFIVDGICYTKLPHQLPDGGCGETTLSVVSDGENTYSGDIVIPETVTFSGETYTVDDIGDAAFYNCTELTSLTLPNTIKVIGFHSISGCPKLMVLDLPAGMVQVFSNAFSDNPNLDYIFVHSIEPFYLWSGAFDEINDHFKIVVPCGALEAFEDDTDWGGYPLMDDCGNVGIEETKTATVDVYPNPASETLTIEAEGEVAIIDETGRTLKTLNVNGKKTIELEGLARGMYFIKAEETVKKVFVE